MSSSGRLYRVRLRLKAPLGTPLTSGTLFGHLCWAVRELNGEKALEAWLGAQEEAPWLLSDGFPADCLPRPLLPRLPVQGLGLKEADQAKQRARLPLLSVEGFLKHRDGLSETRIAAHLTAGPAAAKPSLERVRQTHNSIDRRRGTTPEEGGLFFVEEDWSFALAPERDVYVRAPVEASEVQALLAEVGERGYGRDATWGRGHFTVEEVRSMPELEGEGERRLSLSHGTLTSNMVEARYKLFTHFGKVGDLMAATGARPWKRPVLVARPGTTFRPLDEGPYGELLSGVHQDRSEIRHDARHLTLAYKEAAP